MAGVGATEQIQGVIRASAEDAAVEEDTSPVGRLIGPYQIIQELGHGGMGAVYLAVRADDEYEKLIKSVKRSRRVSWPWPGCKSDNSVRS